MANLNFVDAAREQEKVLKSREQTLAKGLTQPFNNTISGARKNLSATQRDHVLCLYDPEFTLVCTGYEDRFGETSSSFKELPDDYEVVGRVNKFMNHENDHYWLIVRNIHTNELDMIERKGYVYISESYGYTNNNDYLDSHQVGSNMYKGEIVQKSNSFADNNNYRNGVNLRTAYISCDKNTEDALIISESAAKKLAAPLIKKCLVFVNDNDIFLNLYGDNNTYKPFPNIGEEIKDGILCALRREQREESLFTQSCNLLSDILMSDTKYTLNGTVVDINIYCNNPDDLKDSYYNSQAYYYYQDQLRYCQDLVNIVTPFKNNGYKMSYDLQKAFFNAKRILNETQFIREGKVFSNLVIEFTVEERSELEQGDKLADRYGGKGVVGAILPDNMMPQLDNGDYVEIIYNSSTCVNRLNPGQLFETSLTHIGSRLVEYMCTGALDYDACLDLYVEYLKEISPSQATYVEKYIVRLDESERAMYCNTVMSDIGIFLSLKPISESLTIDDIARLYKRFPWASQYILRSPIIDSNGNVRYVNSHRAIVCGKKYIYRLKQYAEDKFSATSLSATNIKNENSRSKASKEYKGVVTKTPIRFGEMETGDLGHAGMEYVVMNLMIHSTSPHARRLALELVEGADPFKVDIKLDQYSSNRTAEILNAYLKTMGLKLEFTKKYKSLDKPIFKDPITRLRPFYRKPITVLPEDVDRNVFNASVDTGYDNPISKIPIDKIGSRLYRKENGYDKS